MTANAAWEALMSAHATLLKQFQAEDIWGDISIREYDVLYTLSKCPAAVRLGELNKHVLLSQPALSRLVDRLADRGLIERKTDPDDRRGLLLSLTEDGRAVQLQIGARHARSVARAMTAGLSYTEMRQLEILCRKLVSPGGTTPRTPGRKADESQHIVLAEHEADNGDIPARGSHGRH